MTSDERKKSPERLQEDDDEGWIFEERLTIEVDDDREQAGRGGQASPVGLAKTPSGQGGRGGQLGQGALPGQGGGRGGQAQGYGQGQGGGGGVGGGAGRGRGIGRGRGLPGLSGQGRARSLINTLNPQQQTRPQRGITVDSHSSPHQHREPRQSQITQHSAPHLQTHKIQQQQQQLQQQQRLRAITQPQKEIHNSYNQPPQNHLHTSITTPHQPPHLPQQQPQLQQLLEEEQFEERIPTLEEFLITKDLEDLAGPLRENGFSKREDFKELDTEDIAELCSLLELNFLNRTKLKKLIKELQQ